MTIGFGWDDNDDDKLQNWREFDSFIKEHKCELCAYTDKCSLPQKTNNGDKCYNASIIINSERPELKPKIEKFAKSVKETIETIAANIIKNT